MTPKQGSRNTNFMECKRGLQWKDVSHVHDADVTNREDKKTTGLNM